VTLNKTAAKKAVGGLSTPSKVQCSGFGLEPRITCPTGAKLMRLPNSVCASCYGVRGHYAMYRARMQTAWARRLDATRYPSFPYIMAQAIGKDRYFRWHDTGDVYSIEYMKKIIAVAKLLPDTRFWLPTKEYRLASMFAGSIPDNLAVRVSLPTIDPSEKMVREYVERFGKVAITFRNRHYPNVCPGQCGPCRLCWSNTPVHAYKYH
jgi:hypothetical protein